MEDASQLLTSVNTFQAAQQAWDGALLEEVLRSEAYDLPGRTTRQAAMLAEMQGQLDEGVECHRAGCQPSIQSNMRLLSC